MLLFSLASSGQLPAGDKLRVFIDCSNTFCDRDYIRSEIKVVDFLRDRLAANVHVLITSQRAGGGGRQYQLIFYGQNSFKQYNDTLQFITDATASDDEKRREIVQYLKLGLAPLIAKTGFASAVNISMSNNIIPSGISKPATDKWNYWVFRLRLNGEFNFDKVYKSSRINTNLSANRTTKKSKIEFGLYRSNEKSIYQYEDSAGTTKYEVKNSNYGIYNSIVKSITEHWSYGYQARYSNNTFSNFRRKLYINPALEYNIFRYSDVNNKFFVLRYGLDITSNKYYDTTLFNKTKETLLGHAFSAAITLNQKWGTLNSGLSYHAYFSDLSLNQLSARINLEGRITGNLSLDFYSRGSLVHDQINLAKGNVSAEDVLSRRRQLGSSFNIETFFGITYRFGSKLNNFVNPSFEGYGGF